MSVIPQSYVVPEAICCYLQTFYFAVITTLMNVCVETINLICTSMTIFMSQ